MELIDILFSFLYSSYPLMNLNVPANININTPTKNNPKIILCLLAKTNFYSFCSSQFIKMADYIV